MKFLISLQDVVVARKVKSYPAGFEPAANGLTVRCSNRAELRIHYCKLLDSNQRRRSPLDLQSTPFNRLDKLADLWLPNCMAITSSETKDRFLG